MMTERRLYNASLLMMKSLVDSKPIEFYYYFGVDLPQRFSL